MAIIDRRSAWALSRRAPTSTGAAGVTDTDMASGWLPARTPGCPTLRQGAAEPFRRPVRSEVLLVRVESVRLELPVEGGPRDADGLRGSDLVAVVLLERGQDRRQLELLDGRQVALAAGALQVERQGLRPDLGSRTGREQAADRRVELPHVSRPGRAHQTAQRGRGEVQLARPTVLVQQGQRRGGDVLGPVAERLEGHPADADGVDQAPEPGVMAIAGGHRRDDPR